ncbi:MAG: hypothetical protein GY940_37500 [bacterium]|nr:hypothetical protein [bacterium]
MAEQVDINKLKKDDFDTHLNTDFEIHFENGDMIAIKLEEVADESKEYAEIFSLIFKGPEDKPLPQQTYLLKHAKMGELALFLVPIGPSHYQCLFNRKPE